MSKFIVIEALDAGGSQTQTDHLVKRLTKERFKILSLHFPQEDQPTGRFVYDKFLLSQNKPHFTRREQALIYLQDFYSRAVDINQHLSRSDKSIVISDRFYTSTLAYQTIGLSGRQRQAMMTWIRLLAEQGTHRLPRPDLVVFLDTPVSISLQHLKNKPKDWFENKAKLTAIRNSYLRVARDDKWLVINSCDENGAQRSIKEIGEEVYFAATQII